MDDHRSPRVATLLGVTLGLLAFNWLSITFVCVRSLGLGTPFWTALTYSYFCGPIWLFVVTAWLGRQRRDLLEHCLKFALSFMIFTGPTTAVAALAPWQLELMFLPMCSAFLIWLAAWPFGVLAIVSTFIPDDTDPPDDPV